MRARSLFAVGAVGAALALGPAACREPTAIVLELTTDVPCADVVSGGGVDIRIGTADDVELSPSSRFQTSQCSGRTIGTLTLVPSGSDDEPVAVLVAVATKANTSLEQGISTDCTSESVGNCVVARRILRYVPHTTLRLPIHLGLACAGVSCAEGETCDPSDGQCHGTDKCLVTPELCSSPGDAGAGDAAACPMCGGTTCVDFATDSRNCGACKSACAGTCANGTCILAPVPNPSTGDGCIAVESGAVVWSSVPSATLSWVPSQGASAGTTLATSSTYGNLSAGGSGAVSVLRTTAQASYVEDWAGTPPSATSDVWKNTAPGSHTSVARAADGTRCATFVDALGLYHVGCPPKFASVNATTLPRKLGPIAAGLKYWAVIVDPDASGAQLVFGDYSGKIVAPPSPASALGGAHAISVVPGTNDFYVAAGTFLHAAVFDEKTQQPLIVPAFSGTVPILGVRATPGPLYFVDATAQTLRVRRAKWTRPNPPVTAAGVLFQGAVTKLGGSVCLDSDPLGVYFLSNGTPMRHAP